MIDLYYWTTPNGHKITIFLEETNFPYQVIPINLANKEQFAEDFLRISPNNKIPAIVDHEPADGAGPFAVFESGAILWYLANKTKQFISASLREQTETLQWLFWQTSGLGPMAGQVHHFTQADIEKIPYAIERYVNETTRLYTVLDKQLARQEYIAGKYSIADMATYPWILLHERQKQNLDLFPHLKRWLAAIQARPAVCRAYELAEKVKAGATGKGQQCPLPDKKS